MDLQSLFFVSLSIEAIIVTLFMIVIIYFFVRLSGEIRQLTKKISRAVEEGTEIAEVTKEYIGKIGKSMIDYFVIKIMKNIRGKR